MKLLSKLGRLLELSIVSFIRSFMIALDTIIEQQEINEAPYRCEKMKTIIVKENIKVEKLAKKLKISSAELITKFFLLGKMVTKKEKLDIAHLMIIKKKYEFNIK